MRWSTLKEQGKIRHIGLSNVTEDQLRRAQRLTPIVSIQNRYNVDDRRSESLIDLCEQEQMVFLPWAPIQDLDRNRAVREIAERHGATPRQVVLAWLLARSPIDAADPRHRIGARTWRTTSAPRRSSCRRPRSPRSAAEAGRAPGDGCHRHEPRQRGRTAA